MKTKKLTKVQKMAREFERAKKLWKVHALALADLKSAERSKSCVVDMNTWRHPATGPGEKCVVCMAGSVMRRRYPKVKNSFDDDGEIGPSDFPKELSAKFSALDSLRTGDIYSALEWIWMGIVKAIPPEGFFAISYHSDRISWWAQQKKILAFLKKHNI